ncbi:MAG: winged helix-turn-helix transcriptional regulator [Clostridia bacterium]|nr:winged helix-turn-helix transcriptional regulator [Clostridia bacterium]
MEETLTQEKNLFSRYIVELKLISDRIAEGKGEKAGIFSNTYQILYILNRKEKVTPKELIAELNMAKSNLAILAKKMMKDGLIESHKDKSNKREIYYNITENGKEMLQEKLDNIDTVCEGDTKKVTNIIIKAVEELKKLENKSISTKKRKTNAK